MCTIPLSSTRVHDWMYAFIVAVVLLLFVVAADVIVIVLGMDSCL